VAVLDVLFARNSPHYPTTLAAFVHKSPCPVWAILDGASCKDMPALVAGQTAASLYRTDDPVADHHAPWLVQVEPDSRLLEDLTTLPGDLHWGIMLSSKAALADLRAHFRKFTMLWTPANAQAPVYFRFYDPRVMSDAILALEDEHLAALLQPVEQLAIPLSPLLGAACGLAALAPRDAFRNRAIQLHLPARNSTEAAKAFAVTHAEFAAMNRLQGERAKRKLARQLEDRHPLVAEDFILQVAAIADERAAVYGLTSIRQIGVFADCMMLRGFAFDETFPAARAILHDPTTQDWQKADLLESWCAQQDDSPIADRIAGENWGTSVAGAKS
jgi:hypothetical protein